MLTSVASRTERALLPGVLGVVFTYLVVSAWEPLRLNWGDPWSDANVLTTLNYSSKYGFIATSFTDVLDVGPLTSESYRYTHYPPFAEIFYGTVRKLAGGQPLDITVYRLFAIAFSGLALFSFFRYVSRVWGARLAAWATILCATNLLWLQFADAMHQAPILFASGMTALAAVPEVIAHKGWRSRVALAIGTYVCFLTAYDYYFFLPIAALLTARILGVPLLSVRMLKLAAFVAVSGALSIATKSAFVIGALGWQGFVEDVHFQFLERATATFSPDYRSGFVIIIATRWTSYFTPAVFVVAALLVWRLAVAVRASGFGASVRALLFGSNPLRSHPASILVLLAAGLPFILVFSQLSVEQVLPSQVMVPFFAVGSAYVVVWLRERRESLALAAVGAFIAWQAVHMARVPKSFLDRNVAAEIGDFLRAHDTNDFVVTNLMSDGPVQYFFERHLHMPSDRIEHTPAGYLELASKTSSGVVHAVFFDDPNTRFIDKSLWSLLPQTERWAVFGAPYVFRQAALGEIREWDARVLEGLRRSGTEIKTLPGVRIFRIGFDVKARRIELHRKVAEQPPSRFIDFGTEESSIHKLTGFRFTEHYPGVPGFCWTVARTRLRTVLTKRGLVYRFDAPPLNESILVLKFDPSADQRVTLTTWGSINGQTLTATIDGHTVLPTHDMGPGQTRQEISFVVPKVLLRDDPVKEVVFRFRDVADYGGGVAFALMRIDPVP